MGDSERQKAIMLRQRVTDEEYEWETCRYIDTCVWEKERDREGDRHVWQKETEKKRVWQAEKVPFDSMQRSAAYGITGQKRSTTLRETSAGWIERENIRERGWNFLVQKWMSGRQSPCITPFLEIFQSGRITGLVRYGSMLLSMHVGYGSPLTYLRGEQTVQDCNKISFVTSLDWGSLGDGCCSHSNSTQKQFWKGMWNLWDVFRHLLKQDKSACHEFCISSWRVSLRDARIM